MLYYNMKYFVIIFSFISICYVQVKHADFTSEDFDTFRISIQIQKDVLDNKLKKYYEPSNGINLGLELPFYIGLVKTNIDFFIYDKLKFQIGDNTYESQKFISIHPNMVWGIKLKLYQNIKWFNGLGLGGYIYYPESNWDSYFTLGKNTETELSFSFSSILDYNLNEKFNLVFSIQHNHVLTYQKIRINSIAIGISKKINNPKWLSMVLR